MNPRIYIASRLEHAEGVREILRQLAEDYNVEVTYDWTKHGSVQSEGPQRIAEVAAAETQGVRDADLVVVLLPGGRGTHAELGIALGAGRKVVIYGDTRDHEGRECAFYYGRSVVHVDPHDPFMDYSRTAAKIAAQVWRLCAEARFGPVPKDLCDRCTLGGTMPKDPAPVVPPHASTCYCRKCLEATRPKPPLLPDQPTPLANVEGQTDLWQIVINQTGSLLLREYMRERREVGIRRYGVALQAHNGRDALTDALQEALDLRVYLEQICAEDTWRGLVPLRNLTDETDALLLQLAEGHAARSKGGDL